MDKKGVFISEGMDRIQSLISGEKRPQRSFSVLTQLNSKKVTIYFPYVWENKCCISSNGTYYGVALKEGDGYFKVREIIHMKF